MPKPRWKSIRAAGKVIYVDHAMIAGLQPETFVSFIQQRGRWAAGMMQLLMLKNPLRRKGMSLSQRLCYLNSMTFWLFPLVRMVFILAPLGLSVLRAANLCGHD
jgi:cellulose synthase (UDP-forming)